MGLDHTYLKKGTCQDEKRILTTISARNGRMGAEVMRAILKHSCKIKGTVDSFIIGAIVAVAESEQSAYSEQQLRSNVIEVYVSLDV